MNQIEVRDAVKTLILLIDTREQDTAKLRSRIEQAGLPYRRQKIDAGDYGAAVTVNGEELILPVAVERKMSLDELANCFCGGRARFIREFERAEVAGTKMYLLVEGASWEKAYAGQYRSRMSPASMVASLLTWSARYNCRIIFCKAETTGKIIAEILQREAIEWLSNIGP